MNRHANFSFRLLNKTLARKTAGLQKTVCDHPKIIFAAVILLFSVAGMISCEKEEQLPEPEEPAKEQIIFSRREFRAAWITTVGSYDWPTTKDNPDAQKAELIAILDRCRALNFNTVIFQIRPTADAFYPSALEPWSVYLTGTQGKDPGYDPLKFAIEEAHKREMELHAWINPYRIGSTSAQLASNHVAVKNPSWVVVYNNIRYFNPGIPEVRQHLVAVVKDIVTRYDVDAIHFDDYFYPDGAKSAGNPFGFNDQAAYLQYGNGADIHTWREDNVKTMVLSVSQAIRSTRPAVCFGISPAGKRENSVKLYADPFVWLQQKWIDYLVPQIYWEFNHPTADFGQVADFWNSNALGIPVFAGIAAYKFKDPQYPAFASVSEFGHQIDKTRSLPNLHGCAFFRIKYLENSELFNYLATKFPHETLSPLQNPFRGITPARPAVTVNNQLIRWSQVTGAVKYAVYILKKEPEKKNSYRAEPVKVTQSLQFSGTRGSSYLVTAVGAGNIESEKSDIVTIK